jgi:hypothetical protein
MDRGVLDLVQVVTAPAQPADPPPGALPTATPLPPPPRPSER